MKNVKSFVELKLTRLNQANNEILNALKEDNLDYFKNVHIVTDQNIEDAIFVIAHKVFAIKILSYYLKKGLDKDEKLHPHLDVTNLYINQSKDQTKIYTTYIKRFMQYNRHKSGYSGITMVLAYNLLESSMRNINNFQYIVKHSNSIKELSKALNDQQGHREFVKKMTMKVAEYYFDNNYNNQYFKSGMNDGFFSMSKDQKKLWLETENRIITKNEKHIKDNTESIVLKNNKMKKI